MMNTTIPELVYTATGVLQTAKPHAASYEAQVAVTILIAILGLWSTFGNTLTIVAIAMHKDMQKKSNYFIFSLAVSDLLSGCIASPLWLYRRTWGYQDWQWGDFLCKLFWFSDESTSYCTSMHIASFAIWRYVGIRWPNKHAKISKKSVKIWLSSIWTVALIFGGAVFCTFYQAEDRSTTGGDKARWPSCSIITSAEGLRRHHVYYTFSSITFMLFPMAVLFTTSILIVKELAGSKVSKSDSRKDTEKRAIFQLGLISASFLLGYIPNIVYVMWTTRATGVDYRLDYWVHIGAYFCLRTSECINPIVYNVSSRRMRETSKNVLSYVWNCCRTEAEVSITSEHRKRNKNGQKNGGDTESKPSMNTVEMRL